MNSMPPDKTSDNSREDLLRRAMQLKGRITIGTITRADNEQFRDVSVGQLER